jgi:hypothetical protein
MSGFLVTADNTHVLFFPFVTELKAVLQCDHTAADKVFKYLMPVMVPCSLAEE